jgi:hypothetical protein
VNLLRRIAYVALMLLVCLDITIQVIWRGTLYVLFAKSKPSARETLSGWFGRAAAEGYWWGLFWQRVVNGLFRNPNHCAEAAAIEASVQTAAYD